MWPFKRCVHEWRVLDKTTIPATAYEFDGPCKVTPETARAMIRATQDRVVLTLACVKCGALDRSDL